MMARVSKQLLTFSVFAMLITDQALLHSAVAAAGMKLSLTCMCTATEFTFKPFGLYV